MTSKKDKPPKPDRKITLTVSTLSGDFTDEFRADRELQVVIDRATKKLDLTGEGPWVLEFSGRELDPQTTIASAGLADGNILSLNQKEGGGGSAGR